MRSVKETSTASKCDLDTFDLYVDALLSSRCRVGIAREEVVGDVPEVIHVEISLSDLIEAESHHPLRCIVLLKHGLFL